MNSFIILQDGVSMLLNMKPFSIDASHPNYSKIVAALKANDFTLVEELINIAQSIANYVDGEIEVNVDAGVLSFAGEEIHNSLTNRILTMMREGFDVQPLVRFLKNLQENPSKRAVDELYGFLEYGKMPITTDGHFLAYKRVNNNYTSVHDCKTDNSIGKTVKMERNKVDDNRDSTCSNGLHFCSHEYLKSFNGDKVVVLKINPRDVVSIPTDYNNTKGRTCEYVVVGELSKEDALAALDNTVWDESVVGAYEDRDTKFDPEGNEAMEDILAMADADRDEDELENILASAGRKDESYEDRLARDVAGVEPKAFIDHDGEDGVLPLGNYADFLSGPPIENLVLNREVDGASQEYVEGYRVGYVDGRAHLDHGADFFGATLDGYDRGLKDGKGHKSKISFTNIQ